MSLDAAVWVLPSSAWIATAGLVGASILDRFLDDGDESGGEDPLDDAGGLDGEFDGGLGGGTDGDLDGGLDEFGEMDDWDDAFDENDDADTDELENRIEELETEVSSLSSTVSTVRSENTEISETVEEVEEDVRSLLDIYEMVTRGINPFVDESAGLDAGGNGAALGLFEDENGGETEEPLDESVADADPDGFFDEDLVEPGEDLDGFDDPEGGDPTFDQGGDAADAGAGGADDGGAGEGDAAAENTTEDDMNDEGKSFSELKAEYDAGEADWADDGVETDEDAPDDGLPDGDVSDDGFETEPASHDGAPDAQRREPRDAPRDPPTGGDPADHGDDRGSEGDEFEYVGQDDLVGERGKPYLTSLPDDYVGDLLVMEWLEFLVEAADVTDAARAVTYYERIRWISPGVAERLREFLSGFGRVDRNVVDRPGTDVLVREHHTRSLRYITQLNGTTTQTVLLDRWDELAGGPLLGRNGDSATDPTSSDPPHTNGSAGRDGRVSDHRRDGAREADSRTEDAGFREGRSRNRSEVSRTRAGGFEDGN